LRERGNNEIHGGAGFLLNLLGRRLKMQHGGDGWVERMLQLHLKGMPDICTHEVM